MTTQRWLQIDLAVLTILGTALLGAGQHDLSLTILMSIAAPTAVLFTDIFQWFRLNRPLANLAALGSVGYALFQFATSSFDNQLLSVANLLVYLQLILLLQEKSHRLNWQLLVLSVLEVVVAAAMQVSVQYFPLLLAFLCCALAAMGMLYKLRECGRVDAAARGQRHGGRAAGFSGSLTDRMPSGARWLLGQAPRATPTRSSAVVERELTRRGYRRQIVWFGGVTMMFALVVFYSTPRLGGTNWQGGRSSRQATVGFSHQVTLDEMGDILQSDELALRISFFDAETGAPLRVIGEPYLRGAVLTRYGESERMGRWTVGRRSTRLVRLPEAEDQTGLVRQEVWLEPTNEEIVFGAFPLVRLPNTKSPLRYDREGGRVIREKPMTVLAASRFKYVVGSLAFREGWQTAVVPRDDPSLTQDDTNALRDELDECLRWNPYSFPRIKEIADQVLREAGATDGDPLRKARVLEQHFLQPGRYQYSLRFRQARNRQMDPIEDFVANHRTGHCEYFATALVLMLRSQKIPARLVVGYHGGEFNSLGNYYLVRQRDAHAWVEMLLKPSDIQSLGESSLPLGGAPNGGWLRLDPTPGGGSSAEDSSMVWNRFDDLMEYAEFLWSDYVIGLNPERQRQSLYAPIWDRVTDTIQILFDPRSWKALPFRIRSAWLERLGFVNSRGVIAWRAVVGLAALVILIGFLARPMASVTVKLWAEPWRRFRQFVRTWRHKGAQPRREVEFYWRLETVLARRGWRRGDAQTPREFLSQIVAKTNGQGPPAWLAGATQVVDAFYRVRFGGAALDKTETAAIEHALRCVDAGLEGRPHPAAKPS